MPIWLRVFTFDEIQKFYIEQNKQVNKANKKLDNIPTGPDIKRPDYTTKARK